MAEWDPDVSYSFGATVTYRGNVYRRSQYPPEATSGIPPNTEMGTDPNGDPIRTWTIPYGANPYAKEGDFHFFHFQTSSFPGINPTTGGPSDQYGPPEHYAENAYGPVYDAFATQDKKGYTIEFGQAGDGYVECPAGQCGVALQQYQETPNSYDPPQSLGPEDQGLIYSISPLHDLIPDPNPAYPGRYIQDPAATHPYTWYCFFRQNHPLLFGRIVTLSFVFQRTETVIDPPNPPVVTITYEEIVNTFTATENNYASYAFDDPTTPTTSASYYTVPANAVFSFLEPSPVDEPTLTVSYALQGVYLKEAESNW